MGVIMKGMPFVISSAISSICCWMNLRYFLAGDPYKLTSSVSTRHSRRMFVIPPPKCWLGWCRSLTALSDLAFPAAFRLDGFDVRYKPTRFSNSAAIWVVLLDPLRTSPMSL